MAHSFFPTDPFNFELQLALGGAPYGCGDVGEILSTADRITAGDADSWCREWTATARRVAAIAKDCSERGHQLSARAAYLRASTYFAMVLSSVDGTKDPDALLLPTFRSHRRCFEAFAELLDPAVEKVEIPYEDVGLPGYFFRPDNSSHRRRTIVLNNGSDGPVTALWPAMGAGGLARGYNVLIFDGPGQQSMLFERNIPFRYDWEHVITPVVDYLIDRPDVEATQLVLYGISQAGYWVPRALAFEHRLAAAIVDPGVFDAFKPWAENLPPEMLQLLDAGDKNTFDQYLAAGMQEATPAERQNWQWRAKPYGLSSPFDVFAAARRYNLTDVVHDITTPVLVADPEGEQFWPGQSQELYDALPGPKQLVHFTAAEGADRHCEPMGRSLLEQRAFDWLDETLTRS